MRWGGESKKKEPKVKAPQTTPTLFKPPNLIPPCTLSNIVGHATNKYPKLPHLKLVVNETFPKFGIPKVHVTLPDSAKKLKLLFTNHPCAL